jgi:hypothetical protein
MNLEDFNRVVGPQLLKCTSTLQVKGGEYATEDRLHNFKIAAALEGTTVRQALAGMMIKHTVSIYDMCMSKETNPMSLWSEKITDHINYLILLRAVVEEESQKLQAL